MVVCKRKEKFWFEPWMTSYETRMCWNNLDIHNGSIVRNYFVIPDEQQDYNDWMRDVESFFSRCHLASQRDLEAMTGYSPSFVSFFLHFKHCAHLSPQLFVVFKTPLSSPCLWGCSSSCCSWSCCGCWGSGGRGCWDVGIGKRNKKVKKYAFNYIFSVARLSPDFRKPVSPDSNWTIDKLHNSAHWG